MSKKSTPERYGSVAIALHRTVSFLIFLQIVGGLAAVSAEGASKIGLLKLHAPLGVVIGLVAAYRIYWWAFVDRRPNDIAGMPRVQSLAAHTVHALLYAAPVALAITGYALLKESGVSLFGAQTGSAEKLDAYLANSWHMTMAIALVALLAVHVCATAYHQFIRQDNLIARMRPNEPAPPTEPEPVEAGAGR